jgi:hypothetical protein
MSRIPVTLMNRAAGREQLSVSQMDNGVQQKRAQNVNYLTRRLISVLII